MPNWKTDKRRSPSNETKCAISGCHHQPVMGFYDYRLCQVHTDYYFDDQARIDRLKKILKIVESTQPAAYAIPKTKLIEAESIQPLEEEGLDDIFPEDQEAEIDTDDFFPKETSNENGPDVALPDAMGDDGTPAEGDERG